MQESKVDVQLKQAKHIRNTEQYAGIEGRCVYQVGQTEQHGGIEEKQYQYYTGIESRYVNKVGQTEQYGGIEGRC